MAYVHVPEWTPEQVADWLQGLDDALRPYIHSFLNNDIDGRHLMTLAADDLHNLHIWKLGHQQLVLETVEQLRQSYFHLDSENLQWLALRLSCKARSVFNELLRLRTGPSEDGAQDRVATSTLSSVADVLTSVKAMVSWLDRPPFERQEPHSTMRKTLLQLSVELATNGQRDKFAERPNDVIREICLNIANMCDELIKESKDPLILQPASLEVATIKKKSNEELGMHIQSLYTGIHIIGRVKYQSPASAGGRVEAGDEIVQVNHQTVVGWQLKKLVAAMKENATEVILTLKKRPKHISGFGRIFPHHFLIPSKKPSPKLQPRKSVSRNSIKVQNELLLMPPPPPPLLLPTPLPSPPTTVIPALLASDQSCISAIETTTEDEDDDSAFLSEVDSRSSATEVHLAVPKLHVALQRRATVTGASPTASRPPVSIDQLWHDVKRDQISRSYSHDIHPSEPHVHFRLPPSPLDRVPPQPSLDDLLQVGGNTGSAPRVTRNPPARPVTCIGDVGGFESARGGAGGPPRVIPFEQWGPGFRPRDSPVIAPAGGELGVKFRTHAEVHQPSEPLGTLVAQVAPTFVTTATVTPADLDVAVSEINSKEERRNESTQTAPQEMGQFVSCGSRSAPSERHRLSHDCRNRKDQDNKEPDSTHRSYQVVVIGGVAQKSPTFCKDASPVLRRKPKREFVAIRRISCKDLGQGDCQGWLLRGRVTKGFLHHFKWTKQWCVLKNTGFYCYEDNNALKAECFICLVGFSISPAVECKTKFSFKVYHSGTSFFFASESQSDMSKWMNKMGLAAIAYDAQSCTATTTEFHRPPKQSPPPENVFFSDSDDEEEDKVSSESVPSAKTHNLQQSTSNSSLSSSSSYYSPLESLSPTSPPLDERSQITTSGSVLPVTVRDESCESDDSFGEARLPPPPPLAAVPDLQVTSARPHAVAVSPFESSNLASIHLHTVGTSTNTLSSCEAFNTFFLASASSRGGTLPTLASSGRTVPDTNLVKASSSLEFGRYPDANFGEEYSAWPAGSATLPSYSAASDSRKMSLAFEMNLDSSSPMPPASSRDFLPDPKKRREERSPSQSSTESLRSSKSMSALKLFGSPKFVKKLMGGGASGHSTWGGESGRAALKKRSLWADDTATVAPPTATPLKPFNKSESGVQERRFLGSPKLARAIYRAIHHKKSPTESSRHGQPPDMSSASLSGKAIDYRMLDQIRISSIPSTPEAEEVFRVPAPVDSVQSPKLRLDLAAAAAVPPVVPGDPESQPGTPRTPLMKPAMGVSMIGKQRRAGSQTSEVTPGRTSATLPAGLIYGSLTATMSTQATQTDNG